MKNIMKDNYVVFQIDNMDEFVKEIKEKTFEFYLSSYTNQEDFIRVHQEDKLTDKIVVFWVNHFSFFSDSGNRVIFSTDYDDLLSRVYKEYCQCMMNKLVDDGYFNLMWDNKKKIVYWKKVRYN
jgi:hypothetical protein